MPVFFMDSFDHYDAADILQKWTGASDVADLGLTTGRTGNGLSSVGGGGSYVYKAFPAAQTLVIGAAFKSSNLSGTAIIELRDASVCICSLRFYADGSIGAGRPLSPISWFYTANWVQFTDALTSAGVLSEDAWHYIEMKVYRHGSAGTIDLKVDEITVGTWTGLDLNDNDITIAAFRTEYGYEIWDDLYLSTDDMLGNVRVDPHFVTAEISTAWTPSAGSNSACVDETMPDGDTTYVASSTANQTDSYTVDPLVNTGAIALYGVQVLASGRKVAIGTGTIYPMAGASTSDGGTVDTSYGYLSAVFQSDPTTGTGWTETSFNTSTFGFASGS